MLSLILLTLLWLAFHVTGWWTINQFTSRRKQHKLILKITLDDKFPFIPTSILLYLSGYILSAIPLVYLITNTTYPAFISTYFFASSLAFVIYILLPTTVEWPQLDTIESTPIRFLFRSWQWLARPHNAVPSLHVAMPLIAASAIFIVNPLFGSLCYIWAGLIAISALLAKKHFVIDLVIGFAFGLVIFKIMYFAFGIL